MAGPARSLSDVPFDRGLQAERTALAWRRTALALALGSLAGARVLSSAFGFAAYAIGFAGLVAGAFFLAAADRRYRRAHESLTATAGLAEGARLANGGVMLAAMTVVALSAGVAGVVFVVVSSAAL